MNKHNIEALNKFHSDSNVKSLTDRIVNHFKSEHVILLVKKNISQWINNFGKTIDKEWLYSDAIITPDTNDIVSCLNMRFLDYIYDVIEY